MNFIKPLLWVHTGWFKKITRALLGSVIAAGVYVGFYYLGRNNKNQSQKYIYQHALPNFLNSFFEYGLFPIICKKIGLLQAEVLEPPSTPELIKRK